MTEKKEIGQQVGVPLSIYQERYGKLDPAEVTRRTGVPFDAERGAFILTILGFKLYAAWPEFALTPEDAENCPRDLYGGEALILGIRYLLEGARELPRGNWLPYRELPWGDVYDRNFQGRCIKRLAFAFGPKPDVFAKACEVLGGVKYSKGDVSYDLEFVPGVTVRLILWSGDDEFPPNSQWLFSDNTPLAFTAEDVAGVGDMICGALKELSKKL
jgi:hypothetical protein